ncbi:P-loop ATPase, Sll1717 family [Methylobacterium aerolatum]|uniref:Orc1-like AAA ATPase domain-containing protein n=1 Tax=Methylobacterium aerolatum TaxID=418708 RepID=A0ABU0I2M4_9HYPH|nr:hypothetical protein [Methylobacterium aerolatum]MDQ0448846.1 hypothetical protein [Methylobacterium aerolatum]GJD34210.1 hypothetical protein FMGBMHLM_1106 [Methylobacterium aerolatum]
MSVSFGDFYKSFGFSEYPFSVYTSENERSHGKDLFVDFSMYSPIIEGFNNGRTMLLAGDRGTGKTAIIYDFCRKVDENCLVVNISDYSDLKVGFNSEDFYNYIICQLSERLFAKMASDKKTGSQLNKSDKVLLSYFLAKHVKQASKDDLHRKIVNLQVDWKTRLGGTIYSILRIPLNIGANATVTFLSDIIAQAAGVAKHPTEFREYFQDMTSAVDDDFSDTGSSLSTLKKLTALAKKVGYSRIVIVLDKIDEDARLNNSAEEIAEFIEPIVTDVRLLTTEEFQVVVALWIIPYNMLKDKVRTQKIYCPSVSWDNTDLVSAANRRVSVFSSKNVREVSSIFEDGSDTVGFLEILELANKNPRDLWHLLDKSFRAQYKIDPNSSKISANALAHGINDFVCQFNFYEYYPRKSNARANSMDIYAYIKHLVKLPGPDFTKNQLNDKAGTGGSTHNYVVAMESMGLVERSGQSGGSTTFRIRDPKVVHALKNNLDIARSN